jgi:hypothetical protein
MVISVTPLVFPADNLMKAEEASGGSLNSTCNCQFCHLGGTKEQKVSDEGIWQHFGQVSPISEASIAELIGLYSPVLCAKVDETIDTVFLEYVISMGKSAKSRLSNIIRDTGVKDSIALLIMHKILDLGAALRTKTRGVPKSPEAGVTSALEDELIKYRESVINPLLFPGSECSPCSQPLTDTDLGMLGVDVHHDTPVEILHTILLGIFWAQTVTCLEKDGKLDELQARLAAVVSAITVHCYGSRLEGADER